MTAPAEIKPCPYCKAHDDDVDAQCDDNYAWVECRVCDVRGPSADHGGSTRKRIDAMLVAVERWNQMPRREF